MKFDVVLAGVGGQGVLSLAVILADSAAAEGLHVKQSEVHGMSQRGGTVAAHVRLSDAPIASDIVSIGGADLVLGVEPLEALRHLGYLALDGRLIASSDPVPGPADYPEPEALYAELRRPANAVLLGARDLARESGSARASAMVLLGAASGALPIPPHAIVRAAERRFARKGERVVDANRRAFECGAAAFARDAASPVGTHGR